jgi:LysM repeat protein
MTDRLTPGDGSPACPFIAFEDERDERSSSPDHRHRCYAEIRPAPRALAHQEAYCLSSAFPVCPTFQDWARREAARAKTADRPSVRAGVPAEPVVTAAVVASLDDVSVDEPPLASDDADADQWSGAPADDEPVIHRNPPRDWAAPPPWATGAGAGAASRTGEEDRPADYVPSRAPGQGLAGSPADRMASGVPIAASGMTVASGAGSDDLADLVAPPTRAPTPPTQPPISRPPSGHFPTTSAAGRRPSVSATREQPKPSDHDGPSWESARRYEAYPTIKTRAALPGIPKIALWGGALAIAALALFFLPGMFSGDGGGTPASSASASPSGADATASPTITPVPSPTPQTYTIKKGDTLNKIAKKFDVTVEQLLAANKQTIKNPNRINVGDEIIIPVPLPDEIIDPSAATPSETATE